MPSAHCIVLACSHVLSLLSTNLLSSLSPQADWYDIWASFLFLQSFSIFCFLNVWSYNSFCIIVEFAWRSRYSPFTEYKDKQHQRSPKVKPKRLDQYMAAGCSVGHKSWLLHVCGCGYGPKLNVRVHIKYLFSKVVSVILGSSDWI